MSAITTGPEADIVGAALHGIENICCLTGDDVTAGDEPEARRVFDLDAIQLLVTANAMRNGHYLSGRSRLRRRHPTEIHAHGVGARKL